jgi:hypothetical protein
MTKFTSDKQGHQTKQKQEGNPRVKVIKLGTCIGYQ